MHELEEQWETVVGADVAAHARLDSVRDGTVTITVDGPDLGDPIAVPRDGRRGARDAPCSDRASWRGAGARGRRRAARRGRR